MKLSARLLVLASLLFIPSCAISKIPLGPVFRMDNGEVIVGVKVGLKKFTEPEEIHEDDLLFADPQK